MEAELLDRPRPSWPAGLIATCACPHCGTPNDHQIATSREARSEARDGQCHVCHGEYDVLPRDGAIVGVKLGKDARTFLIEHGYDIGDQGVTIKAPPGFDARRAAVYIQFMVEEWFGPERQVSNLGIAAALVTYYGCRPAARNLYGEVIDMFTDREIACRNRRQLLADAALAREALREFIGPFLHA